MERESVRILNGVSVKETALAGGVRFGGSGQSGRFVLQISVLRFGKNSADYNRIKFWFGSDVINFGSIRINRTKCILD